MTINSLQTISKIIDQLPGYFVLKSLDSTYRLANLNAAQLLGFDTPNHLIGHTDYDLKCAASQHADQFIKEDQLTLEHGNLKFISHFCYAKDNWKTCIYEKKIFKDDHGAITGISCYVMDITENNLIDLSRFLLTTDGKYNYQFEKYQFAYVVNDTLMGTDLTNRESECLFFILRGKSCKTIARILEISPKTVEYYIDQLKYKMNCVTKSDLIEQALRLGYINFIPKSLMKPKSSTQFISA